MHDIRYLIIVFALFAVLLSAFGVEHYRGCPANEPQCREAPAWRLFPATRMLRDLTERKPHAS